MMEGAVDTAPQAELSARPGGNIEHFYETRKGSENDERRPRRSGARTNFEFDPADQPAKAGETGLVPAVVVVVVVGAT